MRLLLIHADRIRYRATRKTKLAEDIDKREDEMNDCLVVFSCAEKMDEIDADKVVEHGRKEIIDVTRRVKTDKVMIFPFAHLAPVLSSPPVAMNILTRLEDTLRNAGLEVKRAPFGWYKEWEIKDKGHPLSELSRIICPYEAQECDYQCPYCSSPINLELARNESNDTKLVRSPELSFQCPLCLVAFKLEDAKKYYSREEEVIGYDIHCPHCNASLELRNLLGEKDPAYSDPRVYYDLC